MCFSRGIRRAGSILLSVLFSAFHFGTCSAYEVRIEYIRQFLGKGYSSFQDYRVSDPEFSDYLNQQGHTELLDARDWSDIPNYVREKFFSGKFSFDSENYRSFELYVDIDSTSDLQRFMFDYNQKDSKILQNMAKSLDKGGRFYIKDLFPNYIKSQIHSLVAESTNCFNFVNRFRGVSNLVTSDNDLSKNLVLEILPSAALRKFGDVVTYRSIRDDENIHSLLVIDKQWIFEKTGYEKTDPIRIAPFDYVQNRYRFNPVSFSREK